MNARDPLATLPRDDAQALCAFADRAWDEQIVPALTEYIGVPAKSPMFDPDWERNGHIERVVRDAASWVEGCGVAGLKLEVIRLPGRTPVIFFEVPATRAGSTDTVCFGTSTSSRSSPAGAATSGPGRRATRAACCTAAAARTTATRSTRR